MWECLRGGAWASMDIARVKRTVARDTTEVGP